MSWVRIIGIDGAIEDFDRSHLLDSEEGNARLERAKTLGEQFHCLCSEPAPRAHLYKFNDAYWLRRLPGEGPCHDGDCEHYEGRGEHRNVRQRRDTAATAVVSGGGFLVPLSEPPSSVGAEVKDPRPKGGRKKKRERKRRRSTHGTTLGGVIRWLLKQSGRTVWDPALGRDVDFRRLARDAEGLLARTRITSGSLADRHVSPHFSNKDRIALRIEQARRRPGSTHRKLLLLFGRVEKVTTGSDGVIDVKLEFHRGRIQVNNDLWEVRLGKADYPGIASVVGRLDGGKEANETDTRLLILGWTEVTDRLGLRLVDFSLLVTSSCFLPLQSELELRAANALAASNLKIEKPLRAPPGEDFCHDFVVDLGDGRKAIIEVKGRNDRAYNERFERKREYLQRHFPGLHLIWDAAAGEDMPDFVAWLRSLRKA